MKTYNVVQGSPEWLKLRTSMDCASDAAAMMGDDPKLKRDKLLHMRANGDTKEFSEWVKENLFKKGHDVEAAARAILEEEIGEDLYPATIGNDEGTMLASCDGITMSGDDGFEHKLWNEELAAMVKGGAIPDKHVWQLEQQLLIGGMKRIHFIVSDGTREKRAHFIYKPVRGRAKKLIAGWKQFAEDLKNYRAPEVKEAVVADVVMALPTVTIQTEGKVALRSNLSEFGERMQAFVGQIKMKPETDQEFANADAQVKELDRAERALKSAEEAALAQDTTIDELRRTVKAYLELMATTRIALKKAVEDQKAKIRNDIRVGGEEAYAGHIATLNERLGRPYMTMTTVATDFPGVMKGMKSVDSLRNAVNTEVARVKIASSEIADKIAINQKVMNELAGNHKFLFADVATIIFKETEDLTNTVKLRISEHEAKVKADAEAKAQAEAKARETTAAAPAAATPAAAPAAQPGTTSRPARTAFEMPTPAQIIALISTTYGVDRTVAMRWLLKLSFAKPYEAGEIIDMGGPDYVMTDDGRVKEQSRLPGTQ